MGYVGLTTAAAFSSRGLNVTGYDVDVGKVERFNKGDPIIHEPGLKAMLKAALKNGFRTGTGLEPADVYFITVATPSLADGSIDLSFVKEAALSVGSAAGRGKRYQLVVVKSTVTPGTTEGVVKPLVESASGRRLGDGIGLAMNPEFLKEGSAVQDTLEPDRLIIGGADVKSKDTLLRLYKRFYGSRMPRVLRTTPVNAELIKYANNAFLAMKVSYVNMIANLCGKLPGADVEVVAQGIGMDARIGEKFLRAGPGWGGSCWGKDLKNFRTIFAANEVDAPLIDATLKVNNDKPGLVVRAAEELAGGLVGKRVAVLGLAFKADTDDIRESVSLKIIGLLLSKGAEVSAFDPAALENARKVLGERVLFAPSAIDALKGTDCCIIATEWDEFRKLRARD